MSARRGRGVASISVGPPPFPGPWALPPFLVPCPLAPPSHLPPRPRLHLLIKLCHRPGTWPFPLPTQAVYLFMLAFCGDLDNKSHPMHKLEPLIQLPLRGWLEVGQLRPGPALPLPSEERRLGTGCFCLPVRSPGTVNCSHLTAKSLSVRGHESQVQALRGACLPLCTRKRSWAGAGS